MLVLGVLRVKVHVGTWSTEGKYMLDTWSTEGKSTCWYLEY